MQHKYKINEFIQNFVLLFMHKKGNKMLNTNSNTYRYLNITKKKKYLYYC